MYRMSIASYTLKLIIVLSEFHTCKWLWAYASKRYTRKTFESDCKQARMTEVGKNRDWKTQPYGVEDGNLFEKFEADLIDELEKSKGVGTPDGRKVPI